MWTPTKTVHSHAWIIGGQQTGDGSVSAGSNQISLTVTRHADSIGYVLQYSPTTSFPDTIHGDPANVPEMTSPIDGTLPIDGRTSIFKFQERTPDGRIVKTQELFFSDALEQ
jgi:hypothetical protein